MKTLCKFIAVLPVLVHQRIYFLFGAFCDRFIAPRFHVALREISNQSLVWDASRPTAQRYMEKEFDLMRFSWIALILLILSMPLLGQSKTPAESANKQIQSNQNNQSRQYGTQEVPLFIKMIPTPKSPIESQNEDNERGWKKNIDRATISIAGLTLIVLVFQLFVFGRQAQRLKETIEEMQIATKATQKAADAADRTVQTMERTAAQELRAYVFANIDRVMDRSGGWHRSVPIIVQNFGKTPAHDLRTSLYIGVMTYPLKKSYQESFPHASQLETSARAALAPGGYVRQYAILPLELNNAEIEGILSRKYAIFVSSEVEYIDAFDKKHTSRFCAYSIGADFRSGLLATYHEGNDAD
jgi:hypothetical protein